MKITVAKWGNDLAVRLPRDVTEEIHLSEGSPVDIKVEGDALVLRPIHTRYALKDLLVGITPEAMRAAWKQGPKKGHESLD
jgi:antitoxin MazE